MSEPPTLMQSMAVTCLCIHPFARVHLLCVRRELAHHVIHMHAHVHEVVTACIRTYTVYTPSEEEN